MMPTHFAVKTGAAGGSPELNARLVRNCSLSNDTTSKESPTCEPNRRCSKRASARFDRELVRVRRVGEPSLDNTSARRAIGACERIRLEHRRPVGPTRRNEATKSVARHSRNSRNRGHGGYERIATQLYDLEVRVTPGPTGVTIGSRTGSAGARDQPHREARRQADDESVTSTSPYRCRSQERMRSASAVIYA